MYAGKKRLPRYINRAANIGSLLHCFVPSKYVTVTPPGCEEEAARLAQQWKLEEEAEKKKTKWQGNGMTLESLSTRETEMSMGRVGSVKSVRAGPKSNLIDKFYSSSMPTNKSN